MDNEVLIGKAKSSFPGRGTAMRRGKNPSAPGWDLTGRGGTRMSEWEGWRGELREKSQPPLLRPPSSLGYNGRCLGCSGSRDTSKLLVVSLVPIPGAAARLLRAGGTWCSCSSFPQP